MAKQQIAAGGLAACAPRDNYHWMIQEYLENLEARVGRIEALADEIQGTGSDVCEKCPSPPKMSLSDTLRTTPDRLSSIAYRIDEAVNRIRELIY